MADVLSSLSSCGVPSDWSEKERAWFRSRLRAWYAEHRRDLPWRRNPDPYRVWVAEVLLQQTRVEQALPYFVRFLERFPDVFALARASLSEVLKLCEGLGYYARVRNLLSAARCVVEQHGGRLPDRLEALLALPGIGAYTARAILSIGFGKAVPVVDGNVARVLARVSALEGDVRRGTVRETLWRSAEALVDPDDPGEFNQALMELGSLVCRPRDPGCTRCPIASMCRAHALGEPERFPRPLRCSPKPHYHVSAGIVLKGSRILITRRPPRGLLGGLWEFPGGKQEPGETLEACLERELEEELAIRVRLGPRFLSVNHAYSHFRITLHAYLCRHVHGVPRTIGCTDYRWVRLEELDSFAFPRADRKILETLLKVDPFELMPP